ncbi:MAG: hypothetical protein M3483_04835 [Gemmatimonadota bacterium]|nr:hypothetical protein [Gemmatimonadota bacterium]
MAEALARREMATRGWSHVRVASAGIAADYGVPASPYAVVVARRHGIELAAHRSRTLTSELLTWADLVLAMSTSQLHAIADHGSAEKVALLGGFAAGVDGDGGRSVRDPYGADERIYEETLLELRELISQLFDRLSPLLQP